MGNKPFPTQERLHELLERHYDDDDGRLYFVAKVKRGKVKVGDVLYGSPATINKGLPSEHTRIRLGIDGHTQNISVWNIIYEYGDYDRDIFSVDHKDRKPLNDHHTNLRILTHGDQQKNRNNFKMKGASSNYHGVSFYKRLNKWHVQYRDKTTSKLTHIGYYTDELEAAHAYDEASWKEHKDLGKLNFPEKYLTL